MPLNFEVASIAMREVNSCLNQELMPTVLAWRRDPDVAVRLATRIDAPSDIIPVVEIGVGACHTGMEISRSTSSCL